MARKSKPYLKMVVFGIISVGSYLLLFDSRELVMDYFTRGGSYTALPVAAAFYFSFMHGAFASNLLEVLGLQAKKSSK